MGAGDFYVQVGVAYLLADLLAHSQRAEDRISNHEGHLSCGGQAAGNAGTVLLGDAHVQVLPGSALAKAPVLQDLPMSASITYMSLFSLPMGNDFVAEAVAGGNKLSLFHQ